jgi:tetratricopeptide (TPR) repeat protein
MKRSVLLLFLLLFAACESDEARIAGHLESGDAYLKEQKWNEAEIEFKNAVQIDPNQGRAHYGLARALVGKQDLRGAYWELEETVRLDAGNLEARLELGQILLFQNEAEQKRAVALADEVLEAQPNRWEAHVLKARALEALGDEDKAGEHYRAAVAAAPDQGTPLLMWANHLRVRGRNAEAEAGFRKLTEVQPGFAAQAALGGFLALQGRRDEAEAAYRRGVDVAKEKERAPAYLLLANFFASTQRLDEAEKTLRAGVEAMPGDLELIYALARFFHALGRTSEADAMIEQATKAKPDDPEPILLLSSYRGQQGDLDGALAAAEQAVKVAPKDEVARLRRAEVLVDIGSQRNRPELVTEARAVVNAVLAQKPNLREALFVKAKLDLAENAPAEAATSLRQALDQRPDWAQAHFLLAVAELMRGERNVARDEANRALELDANLIEARKLLARIHAALGDHSLAVETGLRALQQAPKDQTLRVLTAQSMVQQGQHDAALEQLEKIPEAERSAEAHYAIARVHMLQRDWSGARPHLMKALDKAPNHAAVLRALFDLDLREKQSIEDVSARVAKAVAEKPGDASLQILQGDVAQIAGRASEAERSYKAAIEQDPNNLDAYQRLAGMYAAAGDSRQVIGTYERALEANPKSGPLHLLLGSLYETNGNTARAIERYEEAIRLDPDLAVAKNNLAYLFAESGQNLDRALDLAQEAKELLPDNPNTADTLGWVLFKKDSAPAAINYLREAVGGMSPDDPNLPLVRHHLAQAYRASGDEQMAVTTWQEALGDIARQTAPQGDRPGKPEPPYAGQIREALERAKAS